MIKLEPYQAFEIWHPVVRMEVDAAMVEEAHTDATLQGRCYTIKTRACIAAQLAIRQNHIFGLVAAAETVHVLLFM